MLLKNHIINLLQFRIKLIFIRTTLISRVTENSQFIWKEKIFYTEKQTAFFTICQ